MEIKRFVGGMPEANCYVISDRRGKSYIIDPGYNPKKTVKYVEDEGLDVQGIVLTHHHYDHCEAAPYIRKELGCPVMIHINDADRYKNGADLLLEDGQTLDMGDDRLFVINTPGHTKGGICLYCPEQRVCFTGDTLFNVDLGRTDLEDGSEEEMCQSILNVCNTWGNDVTIYPGHGDPATMKFVRKHNREFIDIVK